MEDPQATPLLAGAAARLLYEAEALALEHATVLLGRALSPGRAVADAAGFFDGFFEGAGERLIHDKGLRDAVDRWLVSLDGDMFVEHLPLFRRTFSSRSHAAQTAARCAVRPHRHRPAGTRNGAGRSRDLAAAFRTHHRNSNGKASP
jgi:Family of unknown function (DUF5682)